MSPTDTPPPDLPTQPPAAPEITPGETPQEAPQPELPPAPPPAPEIAPIETPPEIAPPAPGGGEEWRPHDT